MENRGDNLVPLRRHPVELEYLGQVEELPVDVPADVDHVVLAQPDVHQGGLLHEERLGVPQDPETVPSRVPLKRRQKFELFKVGLPFDENFPAF